MYCVDKELNTKHQPLQGYTNSLKDNNVCNKLTPYLSAFNVGVRFDSLGLCM